MTTSMPTTMASIVLIPLAACAGIGIVALVVDTVRDVRSRRRDFREIRADITSHRSR